MTTQAVEVIVYRSPLEKAFYDSNGPVNFIFIAIMLFLMVIAYCSWVELWQTRHQLMRDKGRWFKSLAYSIVVTIVGFYVTHVTLGILGFV